MLTFAVTNTQALWYLDRGTGLVSIILLTIVVALGIAQRHGIAGPSGQRFVVTQIHRNAALLSVAFLAIHIASSVIDGFAPITWLDAIIPFASPYRTLWLGLGALAFDLILALIATSLLRQRIGYSAWRSIHWFAYLAWPIAFVHGLGTGTDGREGLVQLVSLVCLGIVVVAVLWRITREWPHDRLVRSLSAVVTVFAVAAIGIWAWNGPMKTGWPRKAGTPASLLATNDGTASSPDTTVASPAPFVPPFTADVAGSAKQSSTTPGANATVTLDGTISGAVSGRTNIIITGRVASGGGVSMQSSAVSIGPDDQPTKYTGTISSLRGTSITVSMNGGGTAFTAQFDIQFDTDTTFSGTLVTTR